MNSFMIGKLEIALEEVKIIWFPIQVITKIKIQIFQVKNYIKVKKQNNRKNSINLKITDITIYLCHKN